jgi:hypothetical protein
MNAVSRHAARVWAVTCAGWLAFAAACGSVENAGNGVPPGDAALDEAAGGIGGAAAGGAGGPGSDGAAASGGGAGGNGGTGGQGCGADGTPCGEAAAGLCHAGSCDTQSCYIDGDWYSDGWYPGDWPPCYWCNVAESRLTWSTVPDGLFGCVGGGHEGTCYGGGCCTGSCWNGTSCVPPTVSECGRYGSTCTDCRAALGGAEGDCGKDPSCGGGAAMRWFRPVACLDGKCDFGPGQCCPNGCTKQGCK